MDIICGLLIAAIFVFAARDFMNSDEDEEL